MRAVNLDTGEAGIFCKRRRSCERGHASVDLGRRHRAGGSKRARPFE